ncbi:MAG: tRNA (cytidine(34)-2'-O)-methyltransferase [Rickettsiales bacterium]
MISIALFEPDIAQNTGSIMRLCACLGIKLHIIEPCGFLLNDRQLKRVAMDYRQHVDMIRHMSWQKFLKSLQKDNRLILLTTKSENKYTDFTFEENDILLLGRESSGVPDYIDKDVFAKIKIPMQEGARSLNIALAAAMVLGESLRQIN